MKFSQILTILSIAAVTIAAPVLEERSTPKTTTINKATCQSGTKNFAACCMVISSGGKNQKACNYLPDNSSSMTCAPGFTSYCCPNSGVSQKNDGSQTANGNKDSTIVQSNIQQNDLCDASTNFGF